MVEFEQGVSVYAAPIEPNYVNPFIEPRIIYTLNNPSGDKLKNKCEKIIQLLDEYHNDLENLKKSYQEKVEKILNEP